MPNESARYVHGTDPDEQGRLTRLNELLNQASLRELSLAGGERILDLGSGLGQLARAMAHAAGGPGRVLGVERSALQIEEARRQARAAGEEHLVEFRQGEAASPPLEDAEWGSFDVTHARFLLEHVPDPLLVVRVMVRATRPGGRVVLADDDHDLLRIWPEVPGLEALWRAYVRTYDRLGNDPFVGRRLVSLLHAAGAVPLRSTWVFFGACSGEATFPLFVANLAAILRGARGAVLATSDLDPEYFERALGALDEFARRPDGAFWYGMSWAEGRRPPSP